MASGHRKRKAGLLAKYVLSPGALTNASESDRGNTSAQSNLINLALYSSGGYTPTITAGSTTVLSDAVSNAQGLWSGTGVNGASGVSGGETTFGIPATTKHYMCPDVGTANVFNPGISSSVIVYSYDGPQANHVPYYINNGIVGTSSISFNNTITGAAGSFPKLKIILAGQVNSSSAGSDNVNIYTGSVGSLATKFNTGLVLTSSTVVYMSASVNTASLLSTNDVLRIVFSSSAAQNTSTTQTAGWWIFVTGSN